MSRARITRAAANLPGFPPAPATSDAAAPAEAEDEAIASFLTSHGLTLTPAAGGFTLADRQVGTSYDHGSAPGVADAASVLAAAHCVLAMRQALRGVRPTAGAEPRADA